MSHGSGAWKSKIRVPASCRCTLITRNQECFPPGPPGAVQTSKQPAHLLEFSLQTLSAPRGWRVGPEVPGFNRGLVFLLSSPSLMLIRAPPRGTLRTKDCPITRGSPEEFRGSVRNVGQRSYFCFSLCHTNKANIHEPQQVEEVGAASILEVLRVSLLEVPADTTLLPLVTVPSLGTLTCLRLMRVPTNKCTWSGPHVNEVILSVFILDVLLS